MRRMSGTWKRAGAMGLALMLAPVPGMLRPVTAWGKLKDLDEVAYVRFASVYREFKDVNTFIDEIGKLLKK